MVGGYAGEKGKEEGLKDFEFKNKRIEGGERRAVKLSVNSGGERRFFGEEPKRCRWSNESAEEEPIRKEGAKFPWEEIDKKKGNFPRGGSWFIVPGWGMEKLGKKSRGAARFGGRRNSPDSQRGQDCRNKKIRQLMLQGRLEGGKAGR